MKKLKYALRRLIRKLFPEKIAALYEKWEEALWYLGVGVLTTGVNFAVYTVLTRLIFPEAFVQNEDLFSFIANWGAWFCAVIFAFFANKSLVFEDEQTGRSFLFQIGTFFLMRLVSGIFENSVPSLLIHVGMHDLLAKALVSVAIIIANYFFSKFISFRKKKEDPPAEIEKTER